MAVFRGFRDFILRGNIIELAVGVVIGVAFNDLVTGFTKDLIQPIINMAGGAKFGGTFRFNHQTFLWGDFVSAVLHFVIIAAVLYFVVVLPMNKLSDLRKRGAAAAGAPPPSEEIVLLTQIRDALVANGGQLPAQRHAATDDPALDSEGGNRQS